MFGFCRRLTCRFHPDLRFRFNLDGRFGLCCGFDLYGGFAIGCFTDVLLGCSLSRFCGHGRGGFLRSLLGRCRSCFRSGGADAAAGQEHVDPGALTQRTLDIDVAPVVLDDGIGHGQAESGQGAARMGGEERFEDMIENFGGHPRTGVGDGDVSVLAGGQDIPLARCSSLDGVIVAADRDLTLVLAGGLKGIGENVAQGLGQLTGVSENGIELVIDLQAQLGIDEITFLPDLVDDLIEQVVQTDLGSVADPAAREELDPLFQIGKIAQHLLDLRILAHLDQRRESGDDRAQIAADGIHDPAQQIHFFGKGDPAPDRFFFGDVPHSGDDFEGLLPLAADRRDLIYLYRTLAIDCAHGESLGLVGDLGQVLLYLFGVTGIDDRGEVLIEDFVFGVTGQVEEVSVRPGDVTFGAQDHDPVEGGVDQDMVGFLRFFVGLVPPPAPAAAKGQTRQRQEERVQAGTARKMEDGHTRSRSYEGTLPEQNLDPQ